MKKRTNGNGETDRLNGEKDQMELTKGPSEWRKDQWNGEMD